MMKSPCLRAILVLLLLLLFCGSLDRVRADALSESGFWTALRQTETLLQHAISSNGDSKFTKPDLDQVVRLWQNVDSVQLADGSSIKVDVRWITDSLANDTAIKALYRRVGAALAYADAYDSDGIQGHAQAKSAALLAALNEVLKDPRFQYEEPTPEPASNAQSAPPAADNSEIVSLIFQIILLAGAAIAVAGVILFALHGLSVGRVTVRSAASGDDPTTSVEAFEKATTSEAAKDYREAIRYLYLASLLRLDERGLIHYDRTLTNREHLAQVADKPQIENLLRPVVNTFDRVWYGFAPVDENGYQDFRQNIEELDKLKTDAVGS